MAARCQYCGEEVRPNSMFCLSCGQLVSRAQSSRKPAATPPPAVPAPVSPPPGARSAAVAPAPSATVPASPTASPAATPSAPVREQASRPTPKRFLLALSTGDRFTITGDALIGRRPEDAGEKESLDAFAINDDTRSVSRVHLHVRIEGANLIVTDRSSANGTKVERQGVVVPCEPGAPVAVQAGDILWFGDVRAEVTTG